MHISYFNIWLDIYKREIFLLKKGQNIQSTKVLSILITTLFEPELENCSLLSSCGKEVGGVPEESDRLHWAGDKTLLVEFCLLARAWICEESQAALIIPRCQKTRTRSSMYRSCCRGSGVIVVSPNASGGPAHQQGAVHPLLLPEHAWHLLDLEGACIPELQVEVFG